MFTFSVGDRVRKNPHKWQGYDHDAPGRGVGVGTVIEPPFSLVAGSCQVRWPSGSCFEHEAGLELVTDLECDA